MASSIVAPFAIGLVDTSGNLKNTQESIALADLITQLQAAGVGVSPATKVWYEGKIMPETTVDGNPEASPLSGVTRISPSGAGTNAVGNGAMGSVLGVSPTYRQVDGRRTIQFVPTVAQNSLWIFQPNAVAGGTNFFLDFAQAVLPGAGPAVPNDILRPPSWQVSCWLRKAAAGDGSDCQHVIGFADTAVTGGQTAEIPRIGLLGDGVGGYRFGSVNCPDGAAAGINNATDIDAGFLQPTALINPGANWFFVRIKMIPPSLTAQGLWACYLNETLVGTFPNLANLPRGHQAINTGFSHLQLVAGSYFRAAGVFPTPQIFDLRMRIADDWDI